LLFDDFYLSQSGYNSSVPRTFGFTTPVTGQAVSLGIKMSGTQIEISWAGGTLESSTSVTSGWAAVPNAAASPYKATPDGGQRFYRVKQ
jgi:hypothetical protein